MFFFTADEHYNHENIIQYSNRPFSSVEEMNETLIANHNLVVSDEDTTIHGGDFSFSDATTTHKKIISRLKGKHIFLEGSHDRWLSYPRTQIWQKTIEGHHVVVCHYLLQVWPRSHYNSWHLYGHSHGFLSPEGKRLDIGVDSHYFFPISFGRVRGIMKYKSDNFNLVRGK